MTPRAKALTATVAVFLVLLLAALAWNRHHRALTDAQRDAEEARLALKGQIVAHQAGREELQAQVDHLLAENTELRAAYDEARRAAPRSRVTAVARLDTGRVPVQPRPAPVMGTGAAGGAGAPIPPTTAPPVVPTKPCPVETGDDVSIEVSGLELQTGQGARLLVGVAAVLRSDRSVLASGPFQAPFSLTTELQVPPPPRWGAALLGACGISGCGPGAAVLFPPVTVLGLRSEFFLGAVAAPSAALVLGGAGVRW